MPQTPTRASPQKSPNTKSDARWPWSRVLPAATACRGGWMMPDVSIGGGRRHRPNARTTDPESSLVVDRGVEGDVRNPAVGPLCPEYAEQLVAARRGARCWSPSAMKAESQLHWCG